MTFEAVIQLGAVLLGGLLAIIGGIVTAAIRSREERQQDSHNLALAFKGEITALVELIEERRYINRSEEIIRQIESTQTPFLCPSVFALSMTASMNRTSPALAC